MSATPQQTIDERRIYALTRPDPQLLFQYFLWSLAGLIFCPIVFIPLFFKYHTLRYRFDSEGISMSWGILFHREINLTYARIQDIHLTRGLIERWLGLASLSIQTASGSAAAEMSLQGIRDYEALRDFLYGRMRGHRATRGLAEPIAAASPSAASPSAVSAPAASLQSTSSPEALDLLRQIHADLAGVRRALQDQKQ
ncbi:MAG: PH domain-containing protein [Candidatus Sumerlaeota bacterium]|nr:PH domain-containing protein [Candidatus Sumerlaeota bacterium]